MITPALLSALSAALALSATTQEAGSDAALRLARLVEVAAIDDACGLLPPSERAILEREMLTARHHAERDGMSSATYASGTARIQRRWATPDCTASATTGHVLRYRQALHGWLLGGERSFEGHQRQWTARRSAEASGDWILAQDARHGPMNARFGTVLIGQDVTVLLAIRSDRLPASAVLVLRDVARAPRPVDFTSGGRRQPPGGEPLAALGALASGQQRIWTNGRIRDGGRLAPEGEGGTTSFTFPADTLERLTALDTQEGARFDLFDAAGARIGRIWIEVGALRQARDYALAANEPR